VLIFCSNSLLQLIPTCIIVFSSLAVISAECGRQDRRRMFNRFSSEVVVEGEHHSDNETEVVNSPRLIKPKRTFPLAILRCVGAFAQIGLFTYLASQKLEDLNNSDPKGPSMPPPGPRFMGREINEDWPLWLPVMHGIVWVYAAILSVVSLLHPRVSNPYKLVTHLDIIYLTTGGAGLIHFMQNDFGRPLGLWSLDDQISGLSALVSAAMCILTLATKPLVYPQTHKAPGKRSRGVRLSLWDYHITFLLQ
jgi:hypothetical protein